MTPGQLLQVVMSLAVVAVALYLSARVARRRMGPGTDPALRVVARQAVSRTQNLVVVEADGARHLVAMTDGGTQVISTWSAAVAPAADTKLSPALDAQQVPAPAATVSPRPATDRSTDPTSGRTTGRATGLAALHTAARAALPALARTSARTSGRAAVPSPGRSGSSDTSGTGRHVATSPPAGRSFADVLASLQSTRGGTGARRAAGQGTGG